MSKRIGILGGISYESTAEYYKLIHKKYYDRKRNYYYPEIILFSLNFQKFTGFENSGDLPGYIEYIMSGIRSLEKAGADFIIMAANSPHAVYDKINESANVPVLSIAESTAEKAVELNLKSLLLLGIKFTMQSSFYREILAEYGIEVITPDEKEQNEINRIIFEDLSIGNIKGKNKILKIISNYSVDGVILGCTELPLLIKNNETDIPLLNTLEIHVEKALEYSLPD